MNYIESLLSIHWPCQPTSTKDSRRSQDEADIEKGWQALGKVEDASTSGIRQCTSFLVDSKQCIATLCRPGSHADEVGDKTLKSLDSNKPVHANGSICGGYSTAGQGVGEKLIYCHECYAAKDVT